MSDARSPPARSADTRSDNGRAPGGDRQRERHPFEEHNGGVEYTVRAARITDIERIVALSGERIRGRTAGQPDAADLLRQLVYLPHASVLVVERRRAIVGGAVLAIRPSVRAGGFVGTIDLLVVDPDGDVMSVLDALVEEAVRSAANKGCASVEAPRPDDPAELAFWERHGFAEGVPSMWRAVAPAGAGGRRVR